uniref:Uncharacterized protein n=1 Tax=Periophthalmus magnuspinnatus TaxID=409849 RepID=A0A3B4BBG0_9GOBI
IAHLLALPKDIAISFCHWRSSVAPGIPSSQSSKFIGSLFYILFLYIPFLLHSNTLAISFCTMLQV